MAGKLPSLFCVPTGRPSDRTTSVAFPKVDVAPALARALARGGVIDLSRSGDGILPTSLAVDIVDIPEARAFAWQGLLSFQGLASGIDALVSDLSGEGRAENYLDRHARLLHLRDVRGRLERTARDLRRAKPVEFNEYGALFFPDAEDVVPTRAVPDYVRDRYRRRDPVPFGFAAEVMEWAGISEGDLRTEFELKGRTGFNLDAVLARSLKDFGPAARASVCDIRKLERIVGRWLAANGVEREPMALAIDLARWNARQTITSTQVMRDIVVPTCDPIDRKSAIKWCRDRASQVDRDIVAATADWPEHGDGQS